jgi:hypothetical protein
MPMETKVSPCAYYANSPYLFCVQDTSLLKEHGFVLVSLSATCSTFLFFTYLCVILYCGLLYDLVSNLT